MAGQFSVPLGQPFFRPDWGIFCASPAKARRHPARVSESATELNLTLPSGYELDDYRMTDLLGKGGFGITYKGEDVRLQRAVAIKEYLPSVYAYRDANSVVRPRSDEDAELFEWGLNRFVDEAGVFRSRRAMPLQL